MPTFIVSCVFLLLLPVPPCFLFFFPPGLDAVASLSIPVIYPEICFTSASEWDIKAAGGGTAPPADQQIISGGRFIHLHLTQEEVTAAAARRWDGGGGNLASRGENWEGLDEERERERGWRDVDRVLDGVRGQSWLWKWASVSAAAEMNTARGGKLTSSSLYICGCLGD